MKAFEVKIEPEALKDIQEISDWYNKKQLGLGRRFQNAAIRQIDSLSVNPQVYAIRYNDIRCMIIRKFPYLVHFYINEQTNAVEVLAVISTDRNPEVWKDIQAKKDKE